MSDIVLTSKDAQAIKTGRKISSYTGVIVHAGKNAKGKELVYSAGNSTGYVLEFDHPFGTQEMACKVLASLKARGVAYQPFESSTTIIDPASEIGDGLTVDGKSATIWSVKTPHSDLLTADVSAPFDEELNHEFKYTPRIERQFSRESSYTRSRLSITQDSISAEVVRATSAETSLSGRLTIEADRITSEVARANKAEGNLSSRITQTADAITSEITRATGAEGTLSSKIDQRLDSITLSVTSSAGSSTFTIKDSSTVLATETLDLSVKAVNISGKLTIGQLNDDAQSKIVTSSQTKVQYYLSTKSDNATGGLWDDTMPTWSSGKYIWTREKTINTFANNATEEKYSPSENGRYDKNLTAALSSAAGAQTAAETAITRERLIFFAQTPAGDIPTAPTAWVNDVTGGKGKWTCTRPEYSRDYPDLYSCSQRLTVGGVFSCSAVKLDATTTVIDGAHIITGSITANKISVSDLSALNATIGGWSIGNEYFGKVTDTQRIRFNSNTENYAISVATRDNAEASWENQFNVSYSGKVTAKDVDLTGKITATSGTIGGCSIENGSLKVPAANITGSLTVGQMYGKTVVEAATRLQYYLSTSNESATGGSWSDETPTWSSGKYIWTRERTLNKYADGTSEYRYIPDENGRYDKNITTALSTAASAQSTAGAAATSAGSAVKRSQTIYRSTSGGSIPSKPSSWVTDVTGDQNKWTSLRPEYSSNYPALYIAQQKETVGGTLTTSDPKIDATTTVIDGAHIITGTIDASKIAVSDLSALNATIGGWAINSTYLTKDTDLLRIRLNAPSAPTSTSNAISVATRGTTSDSWATKFSVTFGGKVTCTDIKITGGEVTGGTVGGATVGSGSFGGITIPSTGSSAGRLIVPGANIEDNAISTSKIVDAAIEAAKIKVNTISTDRLSNAINTSLGYANTANSVFTGAQQCGWLSCTNNITAYGNLILGTNCGFNWAGHAVSLGSIVDGNGETQYVLKWS